MVAGLTLKSFDLCFMDQNVLPVKKANYIRKQMQMVNDIMNAQAFGNDKMGEIVEKIERADVWRDMIRWKKAVRSADSAYKLFDEQTFEDRLTNARHDAYSIPKEHGFIY